MHFERLAKGVSSGSFSCAKGNDAQRLPCADAEEGRQHEIKSAAVDGAWVCSQPAADPLLPPCSPSDTLLVPIHIRCDVRANQERAGEAEVVGVVSTAVSSSSNGHCVLHPR